eukprot:scaffold107842_cov69-Phaeocystis_antarctica.AAC.7
MGRSSRLTTDTATRGGTRAEQDRPAQQLCQEAAHRLPRARRAVYTVRGRPQRELGVLATLRVEDVAVGQHRRIHLAKQDLVKIRAQARAQAQARTRARVRVTWPLVACDCSRATPQSSLRSRRPRRLANAAQCASFLPSRNVRIQ